MSVRRLFALVVAAFIVAPAFAAGVAVESFLQPFTGAKARTYLDKARDVVSVRDFGAKCNSTTGLNGADDTAAIQAAINTGRPVYVPAGGAAGATFCRITAALTIPNQNGFTIYGDSRRTSRIHQSTAGADVFYAAGDYLTCCNGLAISDLTVASSGGRYGVRLGGFSRSYLKNVRVTGFSAGAGVYLFDSHTATLENVELDSNQDGILEDGTATHTGPNNLRVAHSYIGGNARYGVNLYSCAALHFAGNTVEGNAKGGVRCHTAGYGVGIRDNYFEQNRDGTAGTFDVYLGEASFIRACVVESNYFNGRVGGDVSDYYPVRVGYLLACRIGFNFVNVGNRYVNFGAGTVIDTVFEPMSAGDTFDRSVLSTVYGNLPATFAQFRNVMRDTLNYPREFYGSATYDPPSLADGAGVTSTVTVTNAALGDLAVCSFSLSLQGVTLTGYVSAADTVSCRFQNESGGALDLAAGVLRAHTLRVVP